MSRHSSISSARIRRSVSSPNASKPLSTAPRPTERKDHPAVRQPVDGGDLAGQLGRTPPRRRREHRAEADPRRAHGGEGRARSRRRRPTPAPTRTGRPSRPPRRPRRGRRRRRRRPTGTTNPNCTVIDTMSALAARSVTAWTSSCRRTTTRAASRCASGSAGHPSPSGRELAEAGYVAPHWPRPWGLDADPIHQLIIDDELAKAERPAAGQPDRHRLGRPDDPLRRHARSRRTATCGRS